MADNEECSNLTKAKDMVDQLELHLAQSLLWNHTELKEVRTKLDKLSTQITKTLGKWG